MIKICGLTNVADARAALDAGATHLGFNFYPKSPRYLTPEECARIIANLPISQSPISTVGIFVNESVAHVQNVLRVSGVQLAQLHGEETPEMLAALEGRAFKAFRGIGENHAAFARPIAPAFLVDAYSPNGYGGTGQTADWRAAQTLAAQYPLFLAGGLTPENVAQAIEQVRPWGVDVASGVESAPGQKDHAKLWAFVANAQRAFHSAKNLSARIPL